MVELDEVSSFWITWVTASYWMIVAIYEITAVKPWKISDFVKILSHLVSSSFAYFDQHVEVESEKTARQMRIFMFQLLQKFFQLKIKSNNLIKSFRQIFVGCHLRYCIHIFCFAHCFVYNESCMMILVMKWKTQAQWNTFQAERLELVKKKYSYFRIDERSQKKDCTYSQWIKIANR